MLRWISNTQVKSYSFIWPMIAVLALIYICELKLFSFLISQLFFIVNWSFGKMINQILEKLNTISQSSISKKSYVFRMPLFIQQSRTQDSKRSGKSLHLRSWIQQLVSSFVFFWLLVLPFPYILCAHFNKLLRLSISDSAWVFSGYKCLDATWFSCTY